MSVDDFDAIDFAEFTEQDWAAIDAHLARAHPGPTVQIALEDSPFNKFLSWKKHLAVTDLVSPLWCEVQHEYSLYGKRHKPLHRRPSAFLSRNGKQIRVHQQVAHANDRRLKRGKSVHKALEDELHPDKLVVRVTSDEERFGLRLLQLIDGFDQLLSSGITRELPVFTITHDQVVFGVIDEVLRAPLSPPDRARPISSGSPPGAPSRKKQRLSSPTRQTAMESPTVANSDNNPLLADLYELRIVDYKTRRSSNIPSDEDSLSSRLQLMLYHRMLSSVLQPESFDFDLLWNRLRLDPTKPFSAQFLRDAIWEQRQGDPVDSVDLNRLISEWISTVRKRSVGFVGTSQQLQIVYRRSVYVGNRQETREQRAPEMVATVDVDDPLGALALQEELDLARAIEESLAEMRQREAFQVGVIDPPFDEAKPDPVREETTLDVSPIFGRKEFTMNDDELDAHVADVLQWWFGVRPARGVDVGQTYRCLTCEYQDSCEWREQKARESGGGHDRG